MGLPVDDLGKFMAWEDQILHQDGVGEEVNAARLEGMMQVMGYFSGLVQQRREYRDPDADDIVSKAIDWTIHGEPISDIDLLNCLLLLFMAGLDTVSNQLSYAMLHLATHPDDRARIVADPELIPKAIEEILRVYPIVQTARRPPRTWTSMGAPSRPATWRRSRWRSRAGTSRPIPKPAGSTSTAASPVTFRSAVARTAASAPTWPARRWRWCWRSGTSGFRTTTCPGRPSSTAVSPVFGVDSLNLTWR